MSGQTGKDLRIQNGNYEPLGVSFDGKHSNFAVLYEGDFPVWLLLYRKNSKKPFAKLPFSESSRVGSILSLKILDFNIEDYTYNFMAGEEGREIVIQDPYARVIYGREKFGVRKKGPAGAEKAPAASKVRCGYMRLKEAALKQMPIAYCDMIAYGVHVRGFSKKMIRKDLLPEERGTFRALMKSVPYFQDLGVNYISLMPCYEFEEVLEEQDMPGGNDCFSPAEKKKINYWGYGKGNYFALKAAYGASEDVCGEFYAMVEAFHKAGLEVGMELFFPDLVTPKFMEEAVSFWVKYYGIDGFRIYCSEAGQKHLSTVPFLGRTKLMFSHWEAPISSGLLSGERNWKQIGIANPVFLYKLRSFLKGDYRTTESAFYAMTANREGEAVINYMASHDGFTLYDSLSYDYKHNEANGEDNKDGSFENFSWNCGAEGSTRKRSTQTLRMKMLQNAFVILLLSQGTPLIYGGDEFGNSQEGNNNAWCQDNEIGWLNWKTPKCYAGLYPFVKKLIAFRKEHPVFHREKPLRMLDTLSCGYPDVSCHGSQPWRMDFDNDRHGLGLLYCGNYVNRPGEALYVVYNMYWEEQEFYLPRPEKNMEWHLVLDTQFSGEAAFTEAKEPSEKQIFVSPRSIRVYQTKKCKKRRQRAERSDIIK